MLAAALFLRALQHRRRDSWFGPRQAIEDVFEWELSIIRTASQPASIHRTFCRVAVSIRTTFCCSGVGSKNS